MAEEHDALHATLVGRIEALLTPFLPEETPPAETARVARMCPGIYKSGLEPVLAHEGAEREACVRELKHAVFRCLAPPVVD